MIQILGIAIIVVTFVVGDIVMEFLFSFGFLFFAIPVIWWIGKDVYNHLTAPSAEEAAARLQEIRKRENEETEARLLNKAIDEERRRRLAKEMA